MVQRPEWLVGRAAAWSAPRVLPVGRTLTFGSDRVDDPDALVILDHLAAHSSRPLRWTAPRAPALQLLGAAAARRVTGDRERSWDSVITYGRAPVVFHTAGLYTSPLPPARRTVVTVWHGDGPKSTRPPRVRGTFMVTGVERFGRRRIAVHGYPDDHLLVTGRPRVDDLFRGAEEEPSARVLARLGLDERPIVWWLPTWRERRGGSAVAMEASPWSALRLRAGSLDQYQFVVKPHPLAPPNDWPRGWQVVTDADLRREALRFYRLLGRAHAVVTDYSSVWTDLLETRTPICFAMADLASFEDARGFYEPDWRDRLPGPIITTEAEFEDFVLQGWTASHAARRAEVTREIGAVNTPGATARLFDALDAWGVPWR